MAFTPLNALAVTVAVPGARAETTPFASTPTTAALLEVNRMAEAVPLGRLAFSTASSPAPRVSFLADRVTLVGALTTLTVHLAVLSL